MENSIFEIRYQAYEYLRDMESDELISNTKKILTELKEGNKNTKEYCLRKMNEEWEEVKAAYKGEHFHEGMTSREILVNEMQQYLYWVTLLCVANKDGYSKNNLLGVAVENINNVLKSAQDIVFDDVIKADINQMKEKKYFEKFFQRV